MAKKYTSLFLCCEGILTCMPTVNFHPHRNRGNRQYQGSIQSHDPKRLGWNSDSCNIPAAILGLLPICGAAGLNVAGINTRVVPP